MGPYLGHSQWRAGEEPARRIDKTGHNDLTTLTKVTSVGTTRFVVWFVIYFNTAVLTIKSSNTTVQTTQYLKYDCTDHKGFIYCCTDHIL